MAPDRGSGDLDSWSRRILRRSSPSTGLLVALLCPGPGARAFRLLYAAFRVLDDQVDAPAPPDPARLVPPVEAALAGRPGAAPALQALWAVLAGPLGPRLAPAVAGMWAAQRFDLDRRGRPSGLPASDLEAQRARIGDSYLRALWVCSGAPDMPPTELLPLARAATGAHWLRDAQEDHDLGYDNVPAEVDRAAWPIDRRRALRAELDAGLRALDGQRPPWRTRLLLRLLAGRYGRLLRG